MYKSGSARAFYAFLFLIIADQCNAQSPAVGAGAVATDPTPPLGRDATTAAPAAVGAGESGEYVYEVGREYNLTCTLPPVDGEKVVWRRNHSAPALETKDRMVIEGPVFKFNGKWQEDDYGEYTCEIGGRKQTFQVRGNVHPKLPANSNVVEGQNLRLTCKLVGKPYPAVYWLFSNDTVTNASVTDVLGRRVMVNTSDQGALDGELLLQEALRSDAGNYTCYVTEPHAMNSTTIVRVKDKYAALWPFLGICIEVFVLCAIILVYEKRRTKPELDDSDTDNHDQKKS